ncbi:hypothetical protein H7097_03755 [Aeromicrobium sp.]|nr:hypothetical protein [Candidatus Saccharibacteria bacterium]
MNIEPELDLTHDECLVLFDFLSSRIDTEDDVDFSNPDFAQKVALNNLLCALEPIMAEALESNFREQVEEAKTSLTQGLDEDLFN